MIVYHGSKTPVPNPDIYHSRERVDFGRGFYVTSIYQQAKSLCRRYLNMSEKAVISKYELSDTIFGSKEIQQRRFDTYSDEWLDFVMMCRQGNDKTNYDLVIGGVANDKVFDTIELFFQGLITKEGALGRLKYEKPNMQICIRNQSVIDEHLKFLESEEI